MLICFIKFLVNNQINLVIIIFIIGKSKILINKSDKYYHEELKEFKSSKAIDFHGTQETVLFGTSRIEESIKIAQYVFNSTNSDERRNK